jgi:hypothetical protein
MISFFTHSGGAGLIRGEQVAKHLGAKLNPKSGFENDTCIYVKCVPPEHYSENTYIDVVEDSAGLRWVKSHPKVGIIASSKSIYDYLSKKLSNEIVLIPQHHCNFERQVRTRTKVDTVGIIGNKASFQYPIGEFEAKLNSMGMKLKTLIKKSFDDREEVVDFYKQIDIQVVWRPGSDGVLRNPLKLINAMSFGIPTISYPEKDFVTELNGYFWDVKSIDEMIDAITILKNNEDVYAMSAIKSLEKAKEYHIDNICQLYLEL